MMGGMGKLGSGETGQDKLTLKAHARGVRRVAFSPDGKRLLSGGIGGALKVWDSGRGPE